MKKWTSILLTLLLVFALAACSKTGSDSAKDDKAEADKKTEEQKSDDSKKDEKKDDAKTEEKTEEKDDKIEEKADEKKDEDKDNKDNKAATDGANLGLDVLKGRVSELTANGKSVDELMIKENEKVLVTQGGEVVPGIYDMEILEGNGNIMGDRVDFYDISINWIGDMKGAEQAYPSKFRVILLEGDQLEFPAIQKIKLTAIKDFIPTEQLGIGNYIVGRDILPGKYKLSTNVKMDPEYDLLGWDLEIYNVLEDEDEEVSLTPKQSETVVELLEGEILTVDYNTILDQDDLNPDDARLIFVPQK